MIKKICIALSLIIALFTMSLSNIVQANPTFVSDCLGENVDSAECEEDSEVKDSDEQEKDEEIIAAKEMSTWEIIFSFVKTGIALLFILILIYFLLKFLNKRNKLFNQVRALENLGGISVGQNKSIQIVRIGTKVYMIGVGENVELLQEIHDEDVINDLLHNEETNEFQASHLLKSVFNPKASKADSTNKGPYDNFKNLYSNELDKLKENRLKMKNQRKEKED